MQYVIFCKNDRGEFRLIGQRDTTSLPKIGEYISGNDESGHEVFYEVFAVIHAIDRDAADVYTINRGAGLEIRMGFEKVN